MALCVHTQTQRHRETQTHRQTQTDIHRHTLYTHTHTYTYISAHQYQDTACMFATARVSALCCSRGTHVTRGVLWVVMCALTSVSFSLSLSLLLRLSLPPPSPFLSALAKSSAVPVQPGAGVEPNFAMYKHSAVRWATRFCHDTPRDLPALQADDSISITVHPPGVSRTVAG